MTFYVVLLMWVYNRLLKYLFSQWDFYSGYFDYDKRNKSLTFLLGIIKSFQVSDYQS